MDGLSAEAPNSDAYRVYLGMLGTNVNFGRTDYQARSLAGSFRHSLLSVVQYLRIGSALVRLS